VQLVPLNPPTNYPATDADEARLQWMFKAYAIIDIGEDEVEIGHAAEAPCDSGLWNNRAFDICRQNFSGKESAFDKKLEKLAQV